MVRRLWFNGLYTPETDLDVIAIVRNCVNLCNLLSWRLAVLERTKGPPGPGAGAHWGFRLQLLAIKSLPYVALFFAGMIIEPHIRSVHGDS